MQLYVNVVKLEAYGSTDGKSYVENMSVHFPVNKKGGACLWTRKLGGWRQSWTHAKALAGWPETRLILLLALPGRVSGHLSGMHKGRLSIGSGYVRFNS